MPEQVGKLLNYEVLPTPEPEKEGFITFYQYKTIPFGNGL